MSNENLQGKTYVDPKDSGDLTMIVLAGTKKYVLVSPIGIDRTWWRNVDIVRKLVEEYEKNE